MLGTMPGTMPLSGTCCDDVVSKPQRSWIGQGELCRYSGRLNKVVALLRPGASGLVSLWQPAQERKGCPEQIVIAHRDEIIPLTTGI